MQKTIRKSYETLQAAAQKQADELRKQRNVRIQVGAATCENAAGAQDVMDELRKHIEASGRDDIELRRTGCTGRCSREPIVGIMIEGERPAQYEQVDREKVHQIFTSHVVNGEPLKEHLLADDDHIRHDRIELLFCNGDRCGYDLDFDPADYFTEKLKEAGKPAENVEVQRANCFGLCSRETRGTGTHVLVRPQGILYRFTTREDVDRIVQEHILGGTIVSDLQTADQSLSKRFFDLYGDHAFFNRQTRIALRNAGIVDPENIFEYINFLGFDALATVLEKDDPDWIINEVTRSKLRGRGGGGFPTGKKWGFARAAEGSPKYIICNADEGDPGAFMDRSMLESDPFSIIEGMTIGGFAVGATRGFFYIRAEYPLAIRRLEDAIEQCHENNLLGDNILGSGFSFDIELRLGAGAFVCGEETALIHSIEGERGQPRIRPPYPSQSGLWNCPTVINNVETFANIPVIISYGGDWLSNIGTDESGGTKVFALAGKVDHTGLVEVPMGTTLDEVVNVIGGGPPNGKAVKAVQTGGPAGGCIPAKWLDTKIDYSTLADMGSIMGSGGMIVLDEDDCMVSVAQFFMAFSKDESCGKCTPCREGTTRMLEILNRITMGQGTLEDLDKLERLALLVKRTSLCGLGRAAPNPVLSTLHEFREEYEAHVLEKPCPAKQCKALIKYEIDPEKCVGCTVCAKNCPVACIHGERQKPHVIDQSRCIKCGRCYQVCRFDAVNRQ